MNKLVVLFVFFLVGCAATLPRDGGVFRYSNQPVQWQCFPISVVHNGDAELFMGTVEELFVAIRAWNTLVGHEIFQYQGHSDCVIEIQSTSRVDILGIVPDTGAAEKTHSVVKISLRAYFPVLYRDRSMLIAVLAHELGHALGLKHDGEYGSLMYPVFPFGDASTWVQESDLEFIRQQWRNVRQRQIRRRGEDD